MYARMLNKADTPDEAQIQTHLGAKAFRLLNKARELLMRRYDLKTELRFPFGNNYGWGYKFSHKTKHLCYIFFEKGAITLTTQIGGGSLNKLNQIFPQLSGSAQRAWQNKYPCGAGGWINFRILNRDDLNNALKFIEIRAIPKKI